MKKILSFVFLTITCKFLLAQQFVADNYSGRPYLLNQYSEYEGSPFFLDTWSVGTIVMKTGQKADKFLLQFDIYSGQVLFKYEEQSLVVENSLKEFELRPAAGNQYLFRCGYKPLDKNTEATWYLVLQDGPVTLLKQVKKVLQEKEEYNSATKTKYFGLIESWYIAKADGSLIKVKKDKSSLLDALSDKKEALTKFIEKEKLKVKSEEEMKAIVKAYNENAG